MGTESRVPAVLQQPELHYRDWSKERRRKLKLVPVDGSKLLHSATSVVRLSSKRDQLSPGDWKFVMNQAPMMDGEWIAWISKNSDNEESAPTRDLLQALGLHEPTPVDRIAAQASLRLFALDQIPHGDYVRIAHIMAALRAEVPADFRYVTKDRQPRHASYGIVADDRGRLEDIVPAAWAQEHLLHEVYPRNFTSCTAERWREWIGTQGSRLLLAVPIVPQEPPLRDDDNSAPTVHASLRTLALWPRIGVSDRPALERTIEWLKSLESGARLV